jgi:hypothetical protein
VLPLQLLAVGAGFPLKDWPLHLTVAPTFVIGADDVAADMTAVLTAITPILAAQRTLTVRAGPDAGFGHSGKIPVTLVEPSADVLDLHRRLLDELLTVGAEFDDPEFVGPGYRPHVTVTRSARVSMNDLLTLRQAALVDMTPAGHRRLRRVIWARPLR